MYGIQYSHIALQSSPYTVEYENTHFIEEKKKQLLIRLDIKTKSLLLEEFQNVNKKYFPVLLYSDTRSFLIKGAVFSS